MKCTLEELSYSTKGSGAGSAVDRAAPFALRVTMGLLQTSVLMPLSYVASSASPLVASTMWRQHKDLYGRRTTTTAPIRQTMMTTA